MRNFEAFGLSTCGQCFSALVKRVAVLPLTLKGVTISKPASH